MRINQIYSLLNDLNKQLFGDDAVQVKDLSGIVSMGQGITADADMMDKFLGKLVDRIGKTVVRTLDLELEFPNLYMNEFEFGAILQKINTNPLDAIESSEYLVGENNFTPTFADIHKPRIFVNHFTGADTWKYFVSIPEDLFFTAFTSEREMNNFINAVISTMTDSLTISINTMSRTAVNNFMAEKILAGNGVINLVEMFNTTYGLTGDDALSASEAMISKDFLRFSTAVIRKYIKYMANPSVLYNVGDGSGGKVVRATARDNMHVIMATEYITAVESILESDTFHNDMVSLPLYTEVGYWQGNNDGDSINDFDTNTSINLIPSSQISVETAGNRYAVAQSGIIGMLADRQAIAVGLNKMRAGTFNNSIDGYVNQTRTALKQYINDLSENAVIFIVADSIATPAISLDESTLTFANSSADAKTLTATTTPSDATVTWKTSKSAVATVSSGVVSPEGTGTCTISAEITVGGKKYTATCAVTVG